MRRAVVGCAVLAAAVATLVTPAAADGVGAVGSSPETWITWPSSLSVVTPGPFVLAGMASAPDGVGEVRVSVQDPVSKLWLRADGSWGSWTMYLGVLGDPGSTSTTWTVPVPGDRHGRYSVFAHARSVGGVLDPSNAVLSLWVGHPPDASLTSPAARADVFAPVQFAGTAVDDRGVARVRVAIHRADTGTYWRAGGTWGAWQQHDAKLASPGAPSTAWSWSWPGTPPPGRYHAQIEAVDVDGIRDPTRVWQAFTVLDPGPGYLTVMVGRSEWGAAEGCSIVAGSVTLDRVAAELGSRGVTPTGAVVVPTTGESTGCHGGAIRTSSWAELAWLRDTYGWSFVPRSTGALETMPYEQQVSETCGARDELLARGFAGASGLFAYANNTIDETIQSTLVAGCFSFGRRYGDGLTLRSSIAPPWWQRTRSFNGGTCNDAAMPCYSLPVANGRKYESPDLLASLMQPTPGQWRTVQLYRFVEGAHSGASNQWDCTSTDWRQHWTSRAELYCWNDFLSAVDRRSPTAVIASPAQVATAWGRLPGS